MNAGGEFVLGKADRFGAFGGGTAEEGGVGFGGGGEVGFEALFDLFGFARGKDAKKHREKVEDPAQKSPKKSSDRHSIGDKAVTSEPSEDAAAFFDLLPGGLFGAFGRRFGVFIDGAGGDDHRRAESAGVGILKSLVAHIDAKESSDSEGFAGRIDLFEVASEGFFAFVDAADDLEGRALGREGEEIVGAEVGLEA